MGEVDVFSLLVSLTYSLPSLFNGEGPAPLPSRNIQDQHILRLALLAHMTQLLASLPSFPEKPREDFRTPPARDCRPLLDLLQVVKVDPVALWQEIMVALLGFLRSAALFYHYLSGVSAPVELTEILPADQEFAHLTKYLGLSSSPRLLLDSPFSHVQGPLGRRAKHPACAWCVEQSSAPTPTVARLNWTVRVWELALRTLTDAVQASVSSSG